MKMGIQFRYQAGKVRVNCSRFLGYDKDKDGHLVINEEQAKVVKRIFREYLEGSGYKDICNSLMADGIPNGAGNMRWIPSTVHKILTNEKYIGDSRTSTHVEMVVLLGWKDKLRLTELIQVDIIQKRNVNP